MAQTHFDLVASLEEKLQDHHSQTTVIWAIDPSMVTSLSLSWHRAYLLGGGDDFKAEPPLDVLARFNRA